MRINRRNLLSGAAVSIIFSNGPSVAQHTTNLSITYTDPNLNRAVHEEIARRFSIANPDIRLNMSAVGNYDDALQRAFRDALTGDLPDVGYHGLNNVRLLARRGLSVPLNNFVAAEGNAWSEGGYSPAVTAMGAVEGDIHGLPFSISMPIIFFNADLVRSAGRDPNIFPSTWSEIIELGRSIKATAGGIFFDYEATGNWTFMALVQSLGGRVMGADDRTVAFSGPEGLTALELLRQIGEAGAVNMTRDQARQSFAAGTLGILITSSSGLANYERQVAGKFALKTAPFPLVSGRGKLPAAGNAAMIFTKDRVKQQAAWRYLKYVTNPESQTLMVQKTGYTPVNSIAISKPELLGEYYNNNQNHMAALSLLPSMVAWYAFPGENSLKINDVLRDRLREVATLRRRPAEVLPDMVRDVQALLG